MNAEMIRCAVVGLSGYVGREVFSLLLNHSQARVTYLAAQSTTGPVASIWPEFLNRTTLDCQPFQVKDALKNCDVVFLALPHTESMKIAGDLIKGGLKVVDLSADYRLKSSRLYQTWYGHKHQDPRNLSKAVYGLPELYRQKIKKAKLIANPGCYPTAAILGLAPIVASYAKSISSLVVDAKSGVSGAGRKASVNLLFSELNNNFKAYKVLSHQHSPEINQILGQLAARPVSVHFVAHLLPIHRGILNTMYVQLREPCNLAQIHRLYKKFYQTEHFVRVHELGQQPEIRNVAHTNFCDIALAISPDRKMLVITSAIDNLIKGAAGQAVQNMNIMCGINETEGLI